MGIICCNASMEPKERLTSYAYSPNQIGSWEIEVLITHNGVCNSDLHVFDPNMEIIGTVVDKGEMVLALQIGDQVGFCSHNGAGAVAQRIRIDSRHVITIPDAFFSENGIPKLCKQETVYSTTLERQVTHLKQVAGHDDLFLHSRSE